MFDVDETIQWGNYSTEKGVITSNDNGLIVAPCPFDPECKSSALGDKACGRTVLGPWNWTGMGHNIDQRPECGIGMGRCVLKILLDYFSSSTTKLRAFDRGLCGN